MLLLIISLADQPTLESLLKQNCSFSHFWVHISDYCEVRYLSVLNVLCAMLSRSVLSDSLRPHCSPPGSSVHGDSPGKKTGVSCYALLQGNEPGIKLRSSCIAGRFFSSEPIGKLQFLITKHNLLSEMTVHDAGPTRQLLMYDIFPWPNYTPMNPLYQKLIE